MTKEQYKFMKKIVNSKSLCREDLTDNERDMQKFLQEKHFLSQTIKTGFVYYEVTQKGKSEMFEFALKYYRWWIPVIISATALIVSIIALICTSI